MLVPRGLSAWLTVRMCKRSLLLLLPLLPLRKTRQPLLGKTGPHLGLGVAGTRDRVPQFCLLWVDCLPHDVRRGPGSSRLHPVHLCPAWHPSGTLGKAPISGVID